VTQVYRRMWADSVNGFSHYCLILSVCSQGGIEQCPGTGGLGHANLSVTLNVYAQFLPQSDCRAAEDLAELLDET
jgi:hypothetical protein